ncbi:MAG: hypothetical protein E7598_02335 [Ruminococcaceae bacterium]|nr:hypothetical protein [Oscillospiraceae bacterium]
MRNLTIKRNKTFVASLVTDKVYIEDSNSNDLIINGIQCRKLGDLKNGEEKTFSIEESEAKIFVIVDKVSKDYCNEVYTVPAGVEDVNLVGQHRFNLSNSNAFRFDGVSDSETEKLHKKGATRGRIVIIAALLVGVIIGRFVTAEVISAIKSAPQTFSSEGMEITLTKQFKEADYGTYTTCFDSSNIAVFALKEEMALFEGVITDYTVDEYARLVVYANGKSEEEIKNKDGLTYFEYDFFNAEMDVEYHYYTFLYKAHDAFWMVQFATLKEDVQKFEDDIFKYAGSAVFVK